MKPRVNTVFMNKASSLGGKAGTTPLAGQSALQAGVDGLGYTNLPRPRARGKGQSASRSSEIALSCSG